MGFDKKTGFPYAIADVNIIDVNYEKGQSFDHPSEDELLKALEAYGKGDLERKIVVDFRGIALQIEGAPTALNPAKGGAAGAAGSTALMSSGDGGKQQRVSGYDV